MQSVEDEVGANGERNQGDLPLTGATQKIENGRSSRSEKVA